MTSGAVPLPFDHDDARDHEPPTDAPCVYLATRITGNISGSPERHIIELAVAAIRDAVIEATQQAELPWHLRVHAPVEWTTPEQTPNMTAHEVFERNARH